MKKVKKGAILDKVPVMKPKIAQPVRFWLTNSWHFGIVITVGYVWITVEYKSAGKWRKHKISLDNIKTELMEV